MNKLRHSLNKKLHTLARKLLEKSLSTQSIGVLGGGSGVALFHFYYATFANNEEHYAKGIKNIEEIFNKIQDGYTRPTFCDGIAGACWVLELLKEERIVDIDEDIISIDVDEYLLNCMIRDMKHGNFDFLHGAVGYGFYFLKRYQNTVSHDAKLRYKKYISILVSLLIETRVFYKDMMWWKSSIEIENVTYHGFNLGLAHGIPSILNFFSRLVSIDDFRKQVEPLMMPIARSILSTQHKNSTLTSSFPKFSSQNIMNETNSRLAWCYGDLGIGISLWRASTVLNNKNLKQKAISILERTTKRRSPQETYIVDANVCHGAFGVMHIYDWIYRSTSNTLFKDVSKHWARIGVKLTKTTKEVPLHMNKEENDDCILIGDSGIGLVLLSNLSEKRIKWDEALLIT